MNYFGTLMAWLQGFLANDGLPIVAKFAAIVLHDEVPLAATYADKAMIGLSIDDLKAHPFVSVATVAQTAAKLATADKVTIGLGALMLAATVAVSDKAGAVGTTQVDTAKALNDAAALRDAAIATAQAAFADAQAKIDAAGNAAVADLQSRITN